MINFRIQTIDGIDFYDATTISGSVEVDQFTLAPNVTDSAVNAQYVRTFTVSGLQAGQTQPITIIGGTYSIDGGAATADPGIVTLGSQVSIFFSAPGEHETSRDVTVFIGSVTATVSVDTGVAPDTIGPVITVVGGAVTLIQGQTYVEPGVSAFDDRDGEVTVSFTPPDSAQTGTQTITYTARDSSGNESTAIRLINVVAAVNVAPVISIASPSPGLEVVEGRLVTILANSMDTDGSIARVDFFIDGSLIATSSTPPFSAQWRAQGNESSITALAVDNDGASTLSAEVVISVVPLLDQNDADNSAPELLRLSDSVFARSRNSGQHILQRGDDFLFLFRPPFATSGWSFEVAVHAEELSAPELISKRHIGEEFRGRVSAQELDALPRGDYIVVAKMSKGGARDTDIIRFHLGSIG